jgi:hypothetical protein
MRRPCFNLLVCVLLTFTVSVLVPAQDLAATAYDESEGLFFDSAPVFAIVVDPALQLASKSRSPFDVDSPIRLSEGWALATGAYFTRDSLAGLHHLLRC